MNSHTNKRLLFLVLTAFVLGTTGCIGVKREGVPASWPKPSSANNLQQFAGTFSNRSVDRKTGRPSDQSAQLFDFLTGRGHGHGKQGSAVDIQPSGDGEVLQVRLLDQQQSEIDSVLLRQGKDFQFSKRFITLHGPFSGTRAEAGNLGASVKAQDSRLYLATPTDIIGRRTETSVGLFFYFLPMFGTSKAWMWWPRIETHE